MQAHAQRSGDISPMAHKLVVSRVVAGKVSLGQAPVLFVHVVGPAASGEDNLGNLKYTQHWSQPTYWGVDGLNIRQKAAEVPWPPQHVHEHICNN